MVIAVLISFASGLLLGIYLEWVRARWKDDRYWAKVLRSVDASVKAMQEREDAMEAEYLASKETKH